MDMVKCLRVEDADEREIADKCGGGVRHPMNRPPEGHGLEM